MIDLRRCEHGYDPPLCSQCRIKDLESKLNECNGDCKVLFDKLEQATADLTQTRAKLEKVMAHPSVSLSTYDALEAEKNALSLRLDSAAELEANLRGTIDELLNKRDVVVTELNWKLNDALSRLDRCLKVMRAVRSDLLDRTRVDDGVHVVELSNTPWRWLCNEIASLSSGTAPGPDVDGPAEAAHSSVVETNLSDTRSVVSDETASGDTQRTVERCSERVVEKRPAIYGTPAPPGGVVTFGDPIEIGSSPIAEDAIATGVERHAHIPTLGPEGKFCATCHERLGES